MAVSEDLSWERLRSLLLADHQNRERTRYRRALRHPSATGRWRGHRATLLRHREQVPRFLVKCYRPPSLNRALVML